jgi:hypothetical protein
MYKKLKTIRKNCENKKKSMILKLKLRNLKLNFKKTNEDVKTRNNIKKQNQS